MKSIEMILKENAKYKHLYEIQYFNNSNLIDYKTVGADNQKEAIKKAGVKAIGIFKHY
jgi:hypothetical protein